MKKNETDFKEKLRSKGLKLTPQRLAIYRELSSTRSHPSAEWIYKRVKKEQPTISLATVYKTLESLQKAGMVAQVCTHSNSKHYDWEV
ncbi:MAG: transcriptional repressor, partial [Spirochaetota bacterium]|nr:transcriptional repressor [Spirochaetota bacterium]